MNNNLKYFIIVAEELNISKAAGRVFISPQCMSSHIKRLEEAYGVTLFHRKPKFRLTIEGEILLENLRKIQIMENSLQNQLAETCNGSAGVIKIGIHTTRARILMPKLYPRFYDKYPNTKILLHNGVVSETEKLVIKGDLDFFIGPYLNFAKELNTILLKNEKIYFVVSDDLLMKFFPSEFPNCKDKFMKGIDIWDFKDVPLIMTEDSSNMRKGIDNFLKKKNIKPNIVFQANSNDVILELSAMGYGACFCPEMMLDLLYSVSRLNCTENKINVFPISEFDETNLFVLAYHKNSYLPKYTRQCIDIVKEIFEES
nr:LysR family transcriptional regulator [Sedimentibacter sp.]